MHNLEAVITACDVLHTQVGLNFGLQKVRDRGLALHM